MKRICRIVVLCLCIFVLVLSNMTVISAVTAADVATPSDVQTSEDNTEQDIIENTEQENEEENNLDVSTSTDALDESDNNESEYYFLQKYLHDANAKYLESQLDYIDIQINAYEQMYKAGEITEVMLQKIKSQKALIEAELIVAQNESDYYNLIMKKEGYSYDDDVKELKQVESLDYYINNYPNIDYIEIARYVTDYNNAVAKISAKELEVNAISKELELSTLLYNEGEISKLEYAEMEVGLSFAQFELEKLYVDMNTAYYRIQILLD